MNECCFFSFLRLFIVALCISHAIGSLGITSMTEEKKINNALSVCSIFATLIIEQVWISKVQLDEHISVVDERDFLFRE
jgi:hypothetical protein